MQLIFSQRCFIKYRHFHNPNQFLEVKMQVITEDAILFPSQVLSISSKRILRKYLDRKKTKKNYIISLDEFHLNIK